MTTRDDRPVPVHQELARMYKAYDALAAEVAAYETENEFLRGRVNELAAGVSDEIDELRLQVSQLSDELGRCENEHVVRDEAGKPLNLRESYDVLVSTAAAEHQRLVESVAYEIHLGQLMFFAQQRWQSMAEDLWEELQEWHADTCAKHQMDDRIIGSDCSCHQILEAKWNELTHADDWAEFADEPEFDLDGDGQGS